MDGVFFLAKVLYIFYFYSIFVHLSLNLMKEEIWQSKEYL